VAIRQNYSAMVENIDRWTGIFIEEVKRRGELDNTVIVFSSDHGEMLGDHTRWGKTLPYQASAGVPLVIAGPGIESGAVHNGPATIMDLAATFLDYADVRVGVEMDSRSMRPLLEGRTRKHRDVVRSGFGSWRMAFDGRYKLVRGFDPARRKAAESTADAPALLYDLAGDPHENTTVAARYPRHVERLSRWIESAR
jgi:arylsulfatase A-like enzyme